MRFVVGEADAGRRLDAALAALAGIARAQAARWIDDGRVRCDASPARAASQRVAAGSVIEAEPPEPAPLAAAPEAIPLVVLHEDTDLIVIDKPAGLVVHPAPGHASGTLVNALLHHCRDLAGIGGVLRPGIVHRLDRGTSGVMVAAKRDAAHAALAAQFKDHSIERVYLALVRGTPGSDAGDVDRAIGRHPRDRKRMSVQTRSGRAAATHWRVLERFSRAAVTLLEVRPASGRTHQIRVHLASIGLPIVADPVYGRGGDALGLERPALHAAVLGFTHPASGERLRFEAPMPPDLLAAVDTARRREGAA
ncbi:MAG: RluA family pseudouridine synthase [Myxococcota bacterium]|jgi:23S rRNA pseudouridine1911/1915/1917 synthase|nr:RluA family pseudouridine synthase [Myxococcota bacterium]